MWRNEVKDLTANLMAEVCHDVYTERSLQPVTGGLLSGASAITEDGARLDIALEEKKHVPRRSWTHRGNERGSFGVASHLAMPRHHGKHPCAKRG